MAKYHDLVEEYSEQIKSIKAMQKEANALLEKAKAIENQPVEYERSDDPQEDYERFLAAEADTFFAAQEVYQKWQELDDSIQVERERIAQDLQAEYYDVPFAKPRQQGIERFWELAGI